jgi:predicted AAA+ superfamily ATPase
VSPTDVLDTYKRIWFGGFPALATGQVTDRSLFYSSYVQTYLQRDVRDLSQVGDESSFLRFLRACAARTGQLLNLAELARDTDISSNTAKHWLSILQAGFQVHLLQPYHTNVTKRLVKRPKLYFLDTGLATYLTEWSTPDALAAGAASGAILETHVLAELLKSWWHRGRDPQLYYYRDRDGREVDFVFVQDRKLYALEVKRSATPRRQWAKALSPLRRLPLELGPSGIACLCPKPVPLGEAVWAIPVGLL